MKTRPSILRVGDGRGFVVADLRPGWPPLVITAAHCIPKVPPAHLGRFLEECTFQLLGMLSGEPSVYASVAFYDPMADVAVLEQPDNQAMYQEADAYEELLARYLPLAIAVPSEAGRGYVYDLRGRSRPITYRRFRDSVRADGYHFEGGMSGSPIVDARGRALAVVSTSGATLTSSGPRPSGNMASPYLSAAIPTRIRLRIEGEKPKSRKGRNL
jgi:trypsin-like peptidase